MAKGSADSHTHEALLLTGFEAFQVDGITRQNPTIEIVQELAPHADHTAILPVEYQRTYTVFDQLLDKTNPSAWLGLGLATNRTCIEIECIALNVQNSLGPDNAGTVRINRAIRPDGPLAYETNLPVQGITEHLVSQGFSAKTSFHAGTFLCNQVYYQALDRSRRDDSPLKSALFVHVPGPEYQAIDETLDTVRAILDWHRHYTN